MCSSVWTVRIYNAKRSAKVPSSNERIALVFKFASHRFRKFTPNHNTMKYCTSLLSLIFIFSLAVHAQPEVRTERIGMMRGVHDALVIDIPNVKKSWAEKAWRDFTSKYGKADKVRKTNEWLLQSAHLVNYPDIDYVNIFSEALEEEGIRKRFAMWVETDTIFLEP